MKLVVDAHQPGKELRARHPGGATGLHGRIEVAHAGARADDEGAALLGLGGVRRAGKPGDGETDDRDAGDRAHDAHGLLLARGV